MTQRGTSSAGRAPASTPEAAGSNPASRSDSPLQLHQREEQDAQQLFRGALELYGVPEDVIAACWESAYTRGRIAQIDVALERLAQERKA